MLSTDQPKPAQKSVMGLTSDDGLHVSILRLPASAPLWYLVGLYMTLRKEVFIAQKEWSLWQAEDMEFEQYDTFDTVYVIAHRDGAVLGGGRLRRADQLTGTGSIIYSYMIRDAVLGMLPGLPTELCFEEPPTDKATWELTRFVSIGGAGVAALMLRAINDFLFSEGGKSCLCLGTPAFLRMARRVGWAVQAVGPVCGNKDGRFLVFDCPIMDPATLPSHGINMRHQ
ncbi:acyl-homoserine-lactone synthase [Paracoccus aminophilus]|uniref:Acyl-homoserine-lactone synthase n=1 Tax=Paracoccus aminophilus JCM 7686 TaxID=1367847 RepID=S5XZ99_PARAH|nr:acyl-homoserine-lactone synthase [Paracoccus aminophilus]AGT10612.1 acyl-homoserine-lactone synthase [Paracoccus aminophilus JCM 7686]